MPATVVAFQTKPTGPLVFTEAERQEILATAYRTGLETFIGATDDGDEWVGVMTDDIAFDGLDAVCVNKGRDRFEVWVDCKLAATTRSIGHAMREAVSLQEGRMAVWDGGASRNDFLLNLITSYGEG